MVLNINLSLCCITLLQFPCQAPYITAPIACMLMSTKRPEEKSRVSRTAELRAPMPWDEKTEWQHPLFATPHHSPPLMQESDYSKVFRRNLSRPIYRVPALLCGDRRCLNDWRLSTTPCPKSPSLTLNSVSSQGLALTDSRIL